MQGVGKLNIKPGWRQKKITTSIRKWLSERGLKCREMAGNVVFFGNDLLHTDTWKYLLSSICTHFRGLTVR